VSESNSVLTPAEQVSAAGAGTSGERPPLPPSHAEYVRELVANWPPLTESQKERIALLLQPAPRKNAQRAA
jgi:hypothetical protein